MFLTSARAQIRNTLRRLRMFVDCKHVCMQAFTSHAPWPPTLSSLLWIDTEERLCRHDVRVVCVVTNSKANNSLWSRLYECYVWEKHTNRFFHTHARIKLIHKETNIRWEGRGGWKTVKTISLCSRISKKLACMRYEDNSTLGLKRIYEQRHREVCFTDGPGRESQKEARRSHLVRRRVLTVNTSTS